MTDELQSLPTTTILTSNVRLEPTSRVRKFCDELDMSGTTACWQHHVTSVWSTCGSHHAVRRSRCHTLAVAIETNDEDVNPF